MIRRMAYEDLDETMYAILAGTLDYLEKKGGSIDPMTAQAYEYFKKVKGERDELKGNGETGISGSQR
jgi:HD superfamily phosphohydrolase YqeK